MKRSGRSRHNSSDCHCPRGGSVANGSCAVLGVEDHQATGVSVIAAERDKAFKGRHFTSEVTL